jgi:hypothetical protein
MEINPRRSRVPSMCALSRPALSRLALSRLGL